MKTRMGFVSNSSSSSFCVVLKDDMTSMAKITKEQEEIKLRRAENNGPEA